MKQSLHDDCQTARFYSPADRQRELYHNLSQSGDWNKVGLLTDPGGRNHKQIQPYLMVTDGERSQ